MDVKMKDMKQAIERLREAYYRGGPIVSKSIFAVQFTTLTDATELRDALEAIAKLLPRDAEKMPSSESVGPFCNDTGGGWRNVRGTRSLGG